MNVFFSDSLKKIHPADDLLSDSNTPADVINKLKSILDANDSFDVLLLAKEFYGLTRDYMKMPRECMAIMCALIAEAFFKRNYQHDALNWYQQAIDADERRIVFYRNKAIVLLALARYSDVISLVGYINSIKAHLLDYSLDHYKNLLAIASHAAKATGNIEIYEKYQRQVKNLEGITGNESEEKPEGGITREPDQPSQNIYLFACCYNEINLLPFFIDYYRNYVGVSRFFIFDGGSDDGSIEFLEKKNVEIIREQHHKTHDLVLMDFRNNYYKSYRNECDWVIVCDIDEFLYHPNIRTRLAELTLEGVTLPKVEGFDMISLDMPEFIPGEYLPMVSRKGNRDAHNGDKYLVFNPQIDINYQLGCHHSMPEGRVQTSTAYEFKNLHYNSPSYASVILKSNMMYRRLSDWNKQVKAGAHYEQRSKSRLEDYLVSYENAKEVI